MIPMLRIMKAFFPAVLGCYLIACILVTQFNLASLQELGVAVPLTTRIEATVHDLIGLSSSYLVMILLAFVLAFPVAAALIRLLPRWRGFLYTLAGAVAVLAIHLLLKLAFGINGIAAVRSLAGLLSQGLAGALGGYLYHRLSLPHSASEQIE